MPIDEFSADVQAFLARVERGQTVLVARDGAAVARISPCGMDDALESAFPGLKRAKTHTRDIDVAPVPVPRGYDVMAVLASERADRELLS